MEEHEEDVEKFDPGTARYGNFMNYYSFNSADSRIRLLPNIMQYVTKSKLNSNLVCLDVGCNTGELTQALHGCMAKAVNGAFKCQILGVDMDEILIERAREKNSNDHISFKCVDVLGEDFKSIYCDYLEQINKQYFDIVFCFSVTMWIHLNYGDEGLQRFINLLCEISDMLIIEPQPWKCYTKAVRRMKRNNSEPFTHFDNIKNRKEVENYINCFIIEKCNFSRVMQTAPTKWGRQIYFYKRNNV